MRRSGYNAKMSLYHARVLGNAFRPCKNENSTVRQCLPTNTAKKRTVTYVVCNVNLAGMMHCGKDGFGV